MNRCIKMLVIIVAAANVSNVCGQQFNSGGLISYGDKSLKLTENGELNLTVGGNELIKINQKNSPGLVPGFTN